MGFLPRCRWLFRLFLFAFPRPAKWRLFLISFCVGQDAFFITGIRAAFSCCCRGFCPFFFTIERKYPSSLSLLVASLLDGLLF